MCVLWIWKARHRKDFFLFISLNDTNARTSKHVLRSLHLWLTPDARAASTSCYKYSWPGFRLLKFCLYPPLVWSIYSPLSWALGAVTPDCNTWLTLNSKFSSFLQRKKFSLTKSCSAPSFSTWKLKHEILHLLKKLVSGSFTGPCMYVFAVLAIGTVVCHTF